MLWLFVAVDGRWLLFVVCRLVCSLCDVAVCCALLLVVACCRSLLRLFAAVVRSVPSALDVVG